MHTAHMREMPCGNMRTVHILAPVKGRLRQWRKAKGLSQAALADALKRDQATVSRWERGVDPIPLRAVPDVSRITGIPASELRPDVPEIFGGI